MPIPTLLRPPTPKHTHTHTPQEGESGVRVVTGVGSSSPVEDFQLLLEGGQTDQALREMQVGVMQGGLEQAGANHAGGKHQQGKGSCMGAAHTPRVSPCAALPPRVLHAAHTQTRRLADRMQAQSCCQSQLSPFLATAAHAQQMVPLLLSQSIGERQYPRAEACCSALRAACVRQDRPAEWNGFLQRLSSTCGAGTLHAAFWRRLVDAQVGMWGKCLRPGQCA